LDLRWILEVLGVEEDKKRRLFSVDWILRRKISLRGEESSPLALERTFEESACGSGALEAASLASFEASWTFTDFLPGAVCFGGLDVGLPTFSSPELQQSMVLTGIASL
jgi:hypothetical protein